jgi:RNA polymerase subunit RPABC4/transcription elongation factor Spt4
VKSKLFSFLALMAFFLAIFVSMATANFNSVNDQQSLCAAMTTTSATQDDVGMVAIIQNNTVQYAQQSNPAIDETTKVRLDSSAAIDAVQLGDIQALINACSTMRASSNDYYMVMNDSATRNGRTFWAMARIGKSAANPRITLKCPMFVERSQSGMDLIIVA